LQIKKFRSSLFCSASLREKACGVEGQRHSSPSADGEAPCLSGAFTRAVAIFRAIVHCFLPFKQCCELKNSPVGCFGGEDTLQEKASPYYLYSQSKSADLIGTKINI